MKLNRLFEIVYILINEQKITAKELADRFEVSQRTIYRDIDALSECGIPVYASKGKGGGISIVEGFKLDKAMLTDSEQAQILSALQGLSAATAQRNDEALKKLSGFFNAKNTDWVEIDFSGFSSGLNWKKNFDIIKQSVIDRKQLTIEYTGLKNKINTRTIEPIKLIFKSSSWYIHAFCQLKKDYRMFKLNRIMSILPISNTFLPHTIPTEEKKYNIPKEANEPLVLKVDRKNAFRIYDDFPIDDITEDADGNFTIRTKVYEPKWMIGHILSFGDGIECIEPLYIRQQISETLKKSIKKYY